VVRVKICGMMSRDDVELCVSQGVDAVGFIFAPGPRLISINLAERLTRAVPPFVTSVGVFAGNDAQFINEALRRCRLDVLQFSNGEPASFCGGFGRPTIVVIHSDDTADKLPQRRELEVARATAIMLDARVKGKLGGTGVRVNDRVAARMRSLSSLPFILAGGLTPANVASAIRAVEPWGVDVRSGVERAGKKDRRLVERFVTQTRKNGVLHDDA
jgi:phosphoribosylanthranilate isomerase